MSNNDEDLCCHGSLRTPPDSRLTLSAGLLPARTTNRLVQDAPTMYTGQQSMAQALDYCLMCLLLASPAKRGLGAGGRSKTRRVGLGMLR